MCTFWKKTGGLSQDERRFFSFIQIPTSLPLCAPALILVMLWCNIATLWNLVWKQKDCKKYTFKRNNLLHVYYASLNKPRKLSEANWSTWENFHDNYIHSNKVLYLIVYLDPVSSTNNMILYELDSSFGFFSFFQPPVISCELRTSFQAIF